MWRSASSSSPLPVDFVCFCVLKRVLPRRAYTLIFFFLFLVRLVTSLARSTPLESSLAARKMNLGDLYTESGQTLQGSFSAVSTPILQKILFRIRILFEKGIEKKGSWKKNMSETEK